MKKNLMLISLFMLTALPSNAFIDNSYGIFYGNVFEDGKYKVKVLNVKNKSAAQKAGIVENSYIKNINNDTVLKYNSLKTYFASKELPIVIQHKNGEEDKLYLKTKSVKKSEKSQKRELKVKKYIDKKKYTNAIKYTTKYAKKYPYDIEILANKTNALMLNKQYGEAISELNKMYAITKSPAILGTTSSVYIAMNDYVTAKEYAEKALKMDSNEITANAVMFICMADNKNYQKALEHANILVKYDPKSYTSYLYRGFANKNLDNTRSAYSDFQKAYQLSEDLPKYKRLSVIQELIDTNQLRMHKSITNSKKFVELPNWFDICPSEYIYSAGSKEYWNEYWDKRREAYLKSVDYCINNYTGDSLYQAYASVKKKELLANEDYRIERDHRWGQERREEIYKYTKDILLTGIVGAYFVKTAPQTIRHEGTINYNTNINQHVRGTIGTYNHYYFH